MARPCGRQMKQPKATTSSDDAGTLIPARAMRPISSTSFAAQRVTSIASSRARSRPTYRCRRADKVRDGDQSARSRSPAVAARPRRRGDRVNHCGSCMSFAAVDESGVGTYGPSCHREECLLLEGKADIGSITSEVRLSMSTTRAKADVPPRSAFVCFLAGIGHAGAVTTSAVEGRTDMPFKRANFRL